MATQNVAVFKYQHEDPMTTPMGATGRILLYLAVVALFFYLLGPGGFAAALLGVLVLAFTWPKKRLSLGTRYLLCGKTVVYYANVRKMVLRPGQTLILQWGTGELFTLDWDRFPTNARKDQKIRLNKSRKFEKVSKGIIRRVLNAAPGVECVGIDRSQLKEAQP